MVSWWTDTKTFCNLGGQSWSFLWWFEQCCTIWRMAQVTYRDLPIYRMDKRVGDWKSKGSKANITNWPEWVCSQLYTLFTITPQCLEAFFLPYKLNLKDNFQRTNGSDPKIFSKKIPRFLFLGLSPWRIAHRKKNQNPAKRPNGMSPLRPAIPSAPRNFSGFQWNRSSRARSARKTQVVRLGEQWLVGSSFGGSGDR